MFKKGLDHVLKKFQTNLGTTIDIIERGLHDTLPRKKTFTYTYELQTLQGKCL